MSWHRRGRSGQRCVDRGVPLVHLAADPILPVSTPLEDQTLETKFVEKKYLLTPERLAMGRDLILSEKQVCHKSMHTWWHYQYHVHYWTSLSEKCPIVI